MKSNFPVLFATGLILFTSCTSEIPKDTSVAKPSAEVNKQIKDQFMNANQQLMQKEDDEMDYYVKTHKMPFYRTGSGIRYYVYAPASKGDSIREGMEITMAYKVRLLDGTLCYSSAEDGLKTFKVGQEELESGIHKAVQYLKRGDKALILIPSPLAHGLLGDFKKIPPQMPIVYDIELY